MSEEVIELILRGFQACAGCKQLYE
jgi:hypothetical protein